MRVLLILATIFFSISVIAQVADAPETAVEKPTTLSWEPPTSRQDGTLLDPATELSHYNLYCDVFNGQPFRIPGESTAGSYEVNKTQLFPGYGDYSCYLTAVDLESRESPPSNSVIIPWPPARPSAPTNVLLIR